MARDRPSLIARPGQCWRTMNAWAACGVQATGTVDRFHYDRVGARLPTIGVGYAPRARTRAVGQLRGGIWQGHDQNLCACIRLDRELWPGRRHPAAPGIDGYLERRSPRAATSVPARPSPGSRAHATSRTATRSRRPYRRRGGCLGRGIPTARRARERRGGGRSAARRAPSQVERADERIDDAGPRRALATRVRVIWCDRADAPRDRCRVVIARGAPGRARRAGLARASRRSVHSSSGRPLSRGRERVGRVGPPIAPRLSGSARAASRPPNIAMASGHGMARGKREAARDGSPARASASCHVTTLVAQRAEQAVHRRHRVPRAEGFADPHVLRLREQRPVRACGGRAQHMVELVGRQDGGTARITRARRRRRDQ